MQKSKISLWIFLFILIIIPFVSAVPPFQSGDSTDGLQLEIPVIENIQVGENFTFFVHAYNSSSGLIIPNSALTCYLHIYSSDLGGEHLVQANMTPAINGVDMTYELDGNLIELGTYTSVTSCNSSGTGGFFAYSFEGKKTAVSFNEQETKFNIASIFFLAIFGIVFVTFGFLFTGREGLWINWIGIFMIFIGFIIFYYDLSLVTMYSEMTSFSGSAVTGVFKIFAMVIKLLPYITVLVIIFAFVRTYKTILLKRKENDGWDNNNY